MPLNKETKPNQELLLSRRIVSLGGDRNEMTNHIISKCSKLAEKEYKTSHVWAGMVIDREL